MRTGSTWLVILLSVGCKPDDTDTDVEDCSDGLPASTFEGDVGEADVATFCDDVCARDVTGDVVLEATSLTNLDALSCLTAVSGDLYIRSNPDLTSIAGLSNLESVGGNVSIGEALCGFGDDGFACEDYGNPALASLDGLEKLATIGGWLWIGDNDALTTGGSFTALTHLGGANPDAQDGLLVNGNANLVHLPDFPQLTTITGQIEVTGNDSLLSLQGLDALTTHAGWFDPYFGGGFLMLAANPSLTSLDGLQNLERTDGALLLWFGAGDSLTSVDGLDSLTTVGGWIDIWGTPFTSIAGLGSLTTVVGWFNVMENPNLTSLAGLESLATVETDLNIVANPLVTDFDAFESLTTIDGNLQVKDNVGLADVTGMYGLTTVGNDLTVTGNTALGDEAAQALVDEIETVGGTVTVEGNHP